MTVIAVGLHDATTADLDAWDAAAVDGPGGSVWQSRAWAEHAAGSGWRPVYLVDDAGVPLLALRRDWPLVGGGSAYLPRGPIAAGDPPERIVARLTAAVDRLAAEGADVVATDAEIPSATGYPARLEAAGFGPIEEIMPSRHRMAVPLAGGVAAAWERIARKTRQRIGSAQRRGLVVRRFDARGDATTRVGADPARGDATTRVGADPALGDATTRAGADPAREAASRAGADPGGDAVTHTDAARVEASATPGPAADLKEIADAGVVTRPPADLLEVAAAAALVQFHALLEATGTRRGFSIGSRDRSVAWWLAAMRAGHLAYLEVRDTPPADDRAAPEGELLGGAIFFRQGGRLTYGHSGDRADLRATHPGVVHLILWEALRLAVTENAAELDLGGVDVAGARGIPAEGQPMWGLYEFKRAFGGEWIEMTGAHERVLRPRRYAAGRALAATARRIGWDRHG